MDMEDYAELPLDPTVSRLFVNDLKHFKGYERLGSRFKKFWEKHLSYGVGGAEPSKTYLGAFVQKLCDSMLGPQHWMVRADQGRFWNDPVDYHSQSTSKLAFLQVLGDIDVDSYRSWNGALHLENSSSLLTLPTLKSFEGRGIVGSFGPYNKNLHSKLPLTHLRNLELEHCKIDLRHLKALLESCSELLSLKVDCPHAFGRHALGPDSTNINLTKTLEPMSNTLERLTMVLFGDVIVKPLDLRSFRKLRYLEVEQGLLLHKNSPYLHEILPGSIEHVKIRGANGHYLTHVDSSFSALELNRFSFPHLNTLTSSHYEYDDCLEEMLCDRYHGYGDEDIDSFERAERLDVELTVEYELYPCEIDSDEDH
ncbi:hypothetical protein AUEXF2481DRAFT_31392 [Aureobasidium subglaciale EXF-2481]|uniref:F-box domain-containing protein n=1 Tax=Aureobasidium subglaciale (strain EXF-2481) TaxID=1043005 RepID=A0A074Y6P3_AURSE|nr:uncharacterized protein AUEXF2481DRAFT_31392 [Aureobasidium subglaciale EXF-2481]KEQ93375.1 hypothetical protein AUEXF2481DRAFT_31392 [Aureobasidium subglaciale EXF-2481]